MGADSQLKEVASRLAMGQLAPIPTADHLTADMLQKLTDGRLADALGWRYFQRLRIQAAAALPTQALRLFQTPVGGQFAAFNNNAVVYQQNDNDTNIDLAGQLQASYEFWQASLQVSIKMIGNTATSYSLLLPLNPAPAASAAAIANLNAIAEDGVLTNRIGSKDYEKAPLYMFPCEYGVSGAAGAGSGTDFEAIYQNGFGVKYEFPVWHQIEGGVAFGPQIQFYTPILPVMNCLITVISEGILFRDVR